MCREREAGRLPSLIDIVHVARRFCLLRAKRIRLAIDPRGRRLQVMVVHLRRAPESREALRRAFSEAVDSGEPDDRSRLRADSPPDGGRSAARHRRSGQRAAGLLFLCPASPPRGGSAEASGESRGPRFEQRATLASTSGCIRTPYESAQNSRRSRMTAATARTSAVNRRRGSGSASARAHDSRTSLMLSSKIATTRWVLPGKVVIEQALRHSRRFGDGRHRRGGIAALAKQLQSVLDQAASGASRTTGGRRSGPWRHGGILVLNEHSVNT